MIPPQKCPNFKKKRGGDWSPPPFEILLVKKFRGGTGAAGPHPGYAPVAHPGMPYFKVLAFCQNLTDWAQTFKICGYTAYIFYVSISWQSANRFAENRLKSTISLFFCKLFFLTFWYIVFKHFYRIFFL